MIRLWNRVGWYRALAVLLLLGAVGGGVAVAADRQTQQPAANSRDAAQAADREREAKERADREAQQAEADRAARSDAQRKADEAAVAAAEQAKSPGTKTPTPKPGASKPGAPPAPNLPIPTSCAAYTGNRAIGCAELLAFGFGLDQMRCLDPLWKKESGWNHNAYNRSSGATGIPQAVPGIKMAKFGADWKTNARTQIRWGLDYIKGRYGTPCAAWAHSQRTGWY